MRNNYLKIGFIIFNPEYQGEIETPRGHWWAATEWIKKNNLEKKYEEYFDKRKLPIDPEEFLMEGIGAIKLYAYRGQKYCQIPKNNASTKKNALKRFYKMHKYEITGHQYTDARPNVLYNSGIYNQTVISIIDENGEQKYIYNFLNSGG